MRRASLSDRFRGVSEPRSKGASFTEMTEVVLPQHANVLGSVFGGTVMAWVDVCGAITAQRHCKRVCVTAAVDDLAFLAPIRVGDIVRLTGRVNATFRTSLEVDVRVEREDPRTLERSVCVETLMTFVAVDDEGRPCVVPPLAYENDDDTRRRDAAYARREARLARARERTKAP